MTHFTLNPDAAGVRRYRRYLHPAADVCMAMCLNGVYWAVAYPATATWRGYHMQAPFAHPSGPALILWLKGDVVHEKLGDAFKAAAGAFAALSPETRMYCLCGPTKAASEPPAPGG